MSRPVRQAIPLFLFMAFVLSGCSDDTPTAAEAGETLKAHITEVLKEVDARDVVVTDPGGRDIPCGDGRAKRTYSAYGQDSWETRDAAILNTIMFGKLVDIAPYRIIEDRGAKFIKVANEDLRTTVTLHSSINGRYTITGETNCLPIR